ncbi:MAG TPA: hypothetical protein VFH59_10735, partial [Frateuria sp.]|nr:hypothetical protein [Frateuria sp.]
PADRLALDPPNLRSEGNDALRPSGGLAASELYLRPGKYRLVAKDVDGRILTRRSISVAD